MPFDQGTFTEYVEDPRYDLLKKPIKLDKSSKALEIQYIPPCTAKGSYGVPTAANLAGYTQQCWNADGSTHAFEVYLGSDFKMNAQGSGLLLTYTAVQGRRTNQVDGTAFWGCPIEPSNLNGAGTGWSIPWNPTYWFQTMAMKGNASQQPIEQYINVGTLHHVTTPRFLEKYKSAIETTDSIFLTPCIETNFDNDTLSTESTARAVSWLGASGAVAAQINGTVYAPKSFTKFIPLNDLFESAENPGIWCNLNKLRLEFTFRLPTDITFRCGAAAANSSPTYFFITDMKFIMDSSRMQSLQAIENAVEKQQGTMENIAYFENYCSPINYIANSQMVVVGQRDVQQIIVGFPALGQTQEGSAVVNPTQYDSGALSAINAIYGADMPCRTPLTLSPTNHLQNAASYMLYRKACGADRSPLVSPALTFYNYKMYHLYWFPIYHPSMPHRSNDPRDVRIDTAGGAARPAIVVVRRFNGCQLSSDGNVERL